MGDFPIRHARHGRNGFADAADAALGVGEGPVFFEERRAGEEHVRVAGGFVQEQILHHHAFHRGQSGGDMFRVRVGLENVLALNVNALEGTFAGGIQHVGNAQAGFVLQRNLPGLFEQTDATLSSETWRYPGNSCGNEPMSQAPCTLFCPRSGFTPTPTLADIAGGHGEIGHAHHHR